MRYSGLNSLCPQGVRLYLPLPFTASLYFNTALIYGGHKNYPEAIRHMKIYLEMAPDAPNARAAQDEIYKWELQIEKAGKAGGQ
jgi:hypothetical protein